MVVTMVLKNIFTFKEALLKRDIDTLLELFPFMFGYKELDRAMRLY